MSGSLFHYTGIDGLLGILESDSLYATHYQYLNDLNEGNSIRDLLVPIFEKDISEVMPKLVERRLITDRYYAELGRQVHRSEAERLFDVMVKVTNGVSPFFVTSFCKHDVDSLEFQNGLLSQWRGYGGAAGFAIEFDENGVDELVKLESKKYAYSVIKTDTVKYSEHSRHLDRKKFVGVAKELLRQIFADKGIDISDATGPRVDIDAAYGPFATTAPFLKDENFQEECEYRIVACCFRERGLNDDEALPAKEIAFRNQRNTVTPYVCLFEGLDKKLPIKSILVGPHPHQERQALAVEMACESFGYEAGVRMSKIAYRF